jgi:hypothetical protein
LSQLLFAANAPYSYSYLPKFVYKNQVFPVTILVKYYNPKDPPNFEFDTLSLIQPIEPNPVKTLNNNQAFFTFYFKANINAKSLKIPSLAIWNTDHTYALNAKSINVKNLPAEKKDFSGVIASGLRVNYTKISPYDETNKLVTLFLEANEANIEDFHIPGVIDDGVENIKRDGARVLANYYFIVPANKKNITFSYFNYIKKSFEQKSINLNNIKTQIDENLNPKELSFDKVKKYFLIGASILFALLFWATRDKLYIVVLIFSIAFLVYAYVPKKSVCIKEGAPLYILPTHNSNISMQIDKKITKKVLNEYRNYYKIEYKNGIYGWIRKDDVCKN